MARLTEDQKRFIVEEYEGGSTITELTERFNSEFRTNKLYQSFRTAVRSKWYADMKGQTDEFVEQVENPPEPTEPTEPVEPTEPTADPPGTVEENVEVVDVPPEVIVDEDDDEVTDDDFEWADEDEDEDEVEQFGSGYDEDGNEVDQPDIDEVDLDSLPSNPPF